MRGKWGKYTRGFSKKLRLRTPFEGLSVDWLTVLQVTLNRQGVRVRFGLFWLRTGLGELPFWIRQ